MHETLLLPRGVEQVEHVGIGPETDPAHSDMDSLLSREKRKMLT